MKGFNFEKNLSHQDVAVKSTLSVFEGLGVHPVVKEINKNFINPVYNDIVKQGNVFQNQILPDLSTYYDIIKKTQRENDIKLNPNLRSNIIDIMMETGTGKTYTYAKTIFELNKAYGIFKFIVVVPTLSIKAGTIDFLKSDSSREHFKEQYNKTLHLHIVESQKSNKSKKSFIPPAVMSFVNAGNFEKNSIQVMIINAGMINSDTMQKKFDKGLFDKYTVPFDAIAAIKPFLIIDEPHKFGQNSKTWENVQRMRPQFILRYGATFQENENLIYKLTALDSFNQNLVKGVIGHITEFELGKNAIVKFLDSDGTEASFELNENNHKKTVKLSKKESLEKVHPAMTALVIDNLNKNTVVLSNGLELKKGVGINPYSYAATLQEVMIQKTIKHHFEIEKDLLTRDVKIKPITLFFIDNIDEYRNKEGYIRTTVEKYIALEVTELLKTEEDIFYKSYLEKTLLDLSATHGGYFSKDNSEKDEAIESQINEILHDKQLMLDLKNPRRFIFSKWTLREGWDNPNVFQICKLRSSGSEISKLQEVGRGLRLPVNEYGNRVKDEQFFLNYFVDFTESDFVDKLVEDINRDNKAISMEIVSETLTDDMVKQIVEKYAYADTNALLQELIMDKKIIDFARKFLGEGFNYVKQNYPHIFEGISSNKVRKANDVKKQILVRTEKYSELKELWEKLNEKVILEYGFKNEDAFKTMFTTYLKTHQDSFASTGMNEKIAKVEFKNNQAEVNESESVYGRNVASISTMKYSDFLKELSKVLCINLKTVHQSFLDANSKINKFLNMTTIRNIKQGFDDYLMENAINDFGIEYKKVSNSIHPTKLTDENGKVLGEISASDVGVMFSEDKVADKYFFNEMFYDSELEKTNIKAKIDEVLVFTKIPKNSIKIPVAGGKSYSPDFAYVLKFKDGAKKLHFIVETKNVQDEAKLRGEERIKIDHAKKFFGNGVEIEFKTQFSNNKMVDLINEIVNK